MACVACCVWRVLHLVRVAYGVCCAYVPYLYMYLCVRVKLVLGVCVARQA